MKKVLWTAAVLFLIAGVLFAGVIAFGVACWRSPAAVAVEIPPGSSVRSIANELARQRAIAMPKVFELWARARGLNRKLRAGTYDFPAGMTMAEVMRKLARGDVMQFEFRVIEGATIAEIAAALVGQPFLSDPSMPQRFVDLTRDPAFLTPLGFGGAPSLEGYLFPDTYLVARPTDASVLIKRMVGRFREIWDVVAQGGTTTGLTFPQIVTLASIVEKETGVDAERSHIAGVFLNRLRLGMPLQSDPTTIYGLPNFDGNLHRRDLSNPHAYNTYVHPGLPPGPICNPGKAALAAALRPAPTEDLYFVARGDGTHQFSKTLAEHLLAVQKYQIEPSKRP